MEVEGTPDKYGDITQAQDQELDISQVKRLTMDPTSVGGRTMDIQFRVGRDLSGKGPIPIRGKHIFRRCKEPHARPAETDLGTLDSLPLEVLQMSILHLDLVSFGQFRLVNRRADEIIGIIPEFRIITEYAMDVLGCVMAVRMGHLITYQALYEKLCTYGCETCGNLASYLYILRFARVCYPCFTGRPEYLAVESRYAKQAYGLSCKELNTIPRLHSIPGEYYMKMQRRSLELVDNGAALEAGLELHGGRVGMDDYVREEQARKRYEYRLLYDQRQAEGLQPAMRRPRPMRPRSPDGEMNPFRFMAVARMPWYSTAKRKKYWGLYCSGCDHPSSPPPHLYRRYTVESFREHIKKFGMVVDNRHVRD